MKTLSRMALLVALVGWLLVEASVAQLPTPGTSYHVLFATSNLYDITASQSFPPSGLKFGSIQGADWQVTFAAAGAALPGMQNWDGFAPRYHALLSQNGSNLSSRIAVEGPVYNTAGSRLAVDQDDLLDGALENPVDYDEFGDFILSDPDVWTGSTDAGTWSGQSAHEWNDTSVTASVGDAFVGPGWLSVGFAISSSSSARLYGISEALPVPLWGDYDENNVVNGNDLLVWQRSLGGNVPWNDDAYVQFDATDYLAVWKQHYGQTLSESAAAGVPEPGAAVLAAFGCAALVLRTLRVRVTHCD